MHYSDTLSETDIRTKRTVAAYTCNSAIDCVPSNIGAAVPESFINCNSTSGQCICSGCFDLFNDTCQLNKCHRYDSTQNCTDNRKSQRKVILLSAFLSSVGAANFYIGQYLLGRLYHHLKSVHTNFNHRSDLMS